MLPMIQYSGNCLKQISQLAYTVPSSTAKRVVLYRFDRQPQEGMVTPGAYLLESHIELITLDGSLQSVGYADCKALCLASGPGEQDLFTAHNLFERRPKTAGLWVRFTFRDGDILDGLLPHSLLEWPMAGFWLTPPRASAARQRAFIPRAALLNTEILGVVTGTKPKIVTKPEDRGQLTMFDS
jgi:hypothetical protein